MKLKSYKNNLECVAQVLKGGLRPEAHTFKLGRTQNVRFIFICFFINYRL